MVEPNQEEILSGIVLRKAPSVVAWATKNESLTHEILSHVSKTKS